MVPEHPELQKEEKVFEALLDPNRVFNADQTNLKLFPKKSGVLEEEYNTKYGALNMSIKSTYSKFSVTVMFAFSAAGN